MVSNSDWKRKTKMNENKTISLTDVNNTSLLTLFCRAVDSRRSDRIIADPMAEKIAERLVPIIKGSEDELLKDLSQWKVNSQVTVHIALRAAKYDQYARDFLATHPNGVIVNLGCGLDSRFHRLDDGKVVLYDLDFPDVIDLKRRLVEENDRYHFLPYSVLDFRWMDMLSEVQNQPILFLAEGLLMYLKPEEVKSLVQTLSQRYPGSELVCEVFNSAWLKDPWGPMVHRKMQQRLKMGKEAHFYSGLSSPNEMEEWFPGVQFLEDWSYFDTGHVRLGAMRILKGIPFLRSIQYSVRYRLGSEK
jgi:methyltransferase (TIGR00027 family)